MIDKKILVVDDEPLILQLFSSLLVAEGYKVITAERAEPALELLDMCSVQVMFLDQQLPGMNGVELCEKIRKNNPIAIIYAMSGYTSLFELTDCREAGFDDFFAKPMTIETILTATREAFAKIDQWCGHVSHVDPYREAAQWV